MERCYSCMQSVPDDVQVCPHCQAAISSLPLNPSDLMPGLYMGPGEKYEVGLRARQVGSMVVYNARDAVSNKHLWLYELFPGEMCFRPEGVTEPRLRPGVSAQDFAARISQVQMQYQLMDRLRDVPQLERAVEFFTANGTAYILTECPQGDKLDVYLARRGGRLPEKDALQLMNQILTILSGMHQAHILHRTLHLQNFYIDAKGRLTLTGFQSAVSVPVIAATPGLVDTGFLAPEQQRGQEEAPCTDLYAAACCMRALLGGDVQTASPHVRQAIEKALSPMPNQRFMSAEEFQEALSPGVARKTKREKTSVTRAVTSDKVRAKAKKEKKNVGRAVLSVLLVLVTLAVCAAAAVVTFVKIPRQIAWPDWSSVSKVEVTQGEIFAMDMAFFSTMPDLDLRVDDPAVLTAWQSGNQLVLRGDQSGKTALTVSFQEHSHTMQVEVVPAAAYMQAERNIYVYCNGATTFDLGQAQLKECLDYGLITARAEGNQVHISAGYQAGRAYLTLTQNGAEATVCVNVLPSPYESYLKSVPASVQLYEGMEERIEFEYEGIDACKLTITNTSDCAGVVQEGGELLVTGVKPGMAVVQVTDGLQTAALTVEVLPVLSAVTPEHLDLLADGTGEITLTSRSGVTPPDGQMTITADPEGIVTIQRSGDVLKLQPVGIGQCIVTVSDGAKHYDVSINVTQVADLSHLPENPDQLTVEDQLTYELKAAYGDMPELVITHESGDDVADFTWADPTLTVTAVTPGQGTYAISDGVNTRTMNLTVVRKPNDLLSAGFITQDCGRTPSLPEGLRGQYSGIICLNAQENVSLQMQLETRHGTLEDITVAAAAAVPPTHSFDEATSVLTLDSLSLGSTTLTLTAPNGTFSYWIEVFDCLKETPQWPETIEVYGNEPIQDLPFSSWCGTIVPTVTEATGLIQDVTPAEERAGLVRLQTTDAGTATVSFEMDGWKHDLTITVHPTLQGFLPISPVFTRGEAGSVILTPVHTFATPAQITIAEDKSASFTLTVQEGGHIELATTGAEEAGQVALTDGTGNLWPIAYEVVEPVLPNNLLSASFLTEDGGHAPSLTEEQRSGYSGVICLDVQDNVPLDMQLETVHGTLDEIFVEIESESDVIYSFNETSSVLTLSGLPMGGSTLKLTAPNGAFSYWIEVFDCLTEEPRWPDAIELYGKQISQDLPFSSWSGEMLPTVEEATGNLADVTPADKRTGLLRLQGKDAGTFTVKVTIGNWTHTMQVTVHPTLEKIEPCTPMFTRGESGAVELVPVHTFATPANITIAEDESGTFSLTVKDNGNLELSTTGVVKGGRVVLTDGCGKECTVEYSVMQLEQAVMAGNTVYLLDSSSRRVTTASLKGDTCVVSNEVLSPERVKMVELRQGDGVVYGLYEDDEGTLLWVNESQADAYFSMPDDQMYSYVHLTDARVSGDAIVLLMGGNNIEDWNDDGKMEGYTEGYMGDYEFLLGSGNLAYWNADDLANETKPVFKSKSGKNSQPLPDVTAIALYGDFGMAVVEKSGNAGAAGDLYYWGTPPEALVTAMNLKPKAEKDKDVAQKHNLTQMTLLGNDLTETGFAGFDVISLGSETFAAITDDGRVVMAGDNSRGQLGLAEDAKITKGKLQTVNLTLEGDAPREVFCMDGYTLMLTTGGRLYGWGQVPGKGLMAPAEIKPGLTVKSFSPSDSDKQLLVTTEGELVIFSEEHDFITIALTNGG